jgi:hypothetical protein
MKSCIVKRSIVISHTAIREEFRNLAEVYLKLANAAEPKAGMQNVEV